MPLVEVVPHPGTHASCIKQAVEFYTSVNRRPIVVKQEVPGFVANRLQAALCNEAYGLVSRGIISANDLGIYSRWHYVLSSSQLLTLYG